MPDNSVVIPWYENYFCKEYWQFAEHEYNDERNELENNFLKKLLASYHVSNVADIGCGLGRHAIPLTENGYEVHGIDISKWALSKLKKKATNNKKLFLYNLDVLNNQILPVTGIDAIIVIQSFGWGSDYQQFMLLNSFRNSLNDGGVLVLEITNPIWILKNYSPTAEVILSNVKYRFNRRICSKTFRSIGTLEIISNSNRKILYHDIRLYNLHEILKLVKKSGFALDSIYSDFKKDLIDENARYYQIIARKRKHLADCLAIATHKDKNVMQRHSSLYLDLTTSSDEELLHKYDIKKVVEKNEVPWNIVKDYSLDDPFHRKKSFTIIRDFFNKNLTANNFFWGAGVTSLIYQLSNVFESSRYIISKFSYPDFSEWLRFTSIDEFKLDYKNNESTDKLIKKSIAENTEIIVFENPDIFGNLISKKNFNLLNKFADTNNIIVIVDESNINYCPPSYSLVNEIHKTKNLIILRGFSKAYFAGGLRAGLLFCSENLFPLLSNTLPPLQVSSFSVFLALEFIQKGDLMKDVRGIIVSHKKEVVRLLTEKEFNVCGEANYLPWLIIENSDDLNFHRLLKYGIISKYISTSNHDFIKLCVPLSKDKLQKFRNMLKVWQ